jgi:thioredoxin-dependent peroxiredoxin
VKQLTKFLAAACTIAALTICMRPAAATGGGKDVKVGDKAPTFEAVDENGKPWKSSDVVGKKILVLYFYPADFTGGCTAQACGFRDNLDTLKSKDVEVVGVSADTPKTHQMFKKYHKLTFTLLSDEKGDLAKKFGVSVKVGQGKATGFDDQGGKVDVLREATISRVTVVIDKQGNIAAIDAVPKAGDDAKRVAEVVQKLEKK